MKKIILSICYLLCFLLSATTELYAQDETTITGSVADQAGNPLSYASMSLLKAADSSLFHGTTSSERGDFTYEHVPQGVYVIKASAVGFATIFSPVFIVRGDTGQMTLPVFRLVPANNQLAQVTVNAARPLVEHATDRTIVHVANSIFAAGNNALDILRRAPGVNIDKDDNISLKGKPGVNVMIDDKPTYLSPAQLAILLRSTDGNTIQSIELISNPSAKYDAAGNSGIINIRLKKNKKSGTNGTVALGAGFGRYVKDNESLSLSHQEGKINVFGSFNRNDDPTYSDIHVNKIIAGNTGDTRFVQHNFISGTGYNNSYRGGVDYQLTAKNTLGFLINGHANGEHDKNNDQDLIGKHPGIIDASQNTLSDIDQHYHQFALNLNDKLLIDTSGQQISLDLDYSRFNNLSLTQHDTYYFRPDGSVQMPPAFLRTQTPSAIRIRTAKVDYSLPVSKSLKLETGAKISDVNTDNALNAQQTDQGKYVNDTLLTNHFRYQERIAAAYINLNKSYPGLTLQAGLRAEYTSSTGTLFGAGQHAVRRRYPDLFPSVFINRSLNDKNELGISYSRRIDRPGYDNLNPFIYYVDQYTYQVGNPFLKPQYTNKIELNDTYNKMVNVSAGFSRTSAVITELFVTKGDTSIDQTLNLNSQNYYDLDINAPYTVTSWWTGNVDLTGFYTQVRSDTLLGGHLNNNKAAFQFKTTQTFQFAKGFKGELTADYASPQIMGIYTMKPYYGVDAGLSRSFAANRMNIKLAVNDIFNSYSMIATANYQTDNIYFKQKGETRVARLTFTYNFGSSQQKAPQHSSGAADENGRVKGNN